MGDWVVDENWTVTGHESRTSTEPAGKHDRAVVPREGAVFGFCGAGRVARALYWLNRYGLTDTAATRNQENATRRRLNIIGLGLWAPGDEDRLRLLFNPESARGDNPYQLHRTAVDPQSAPPDVKLVNLAPVLVKPRNEITGEEWPFCTTRVYRLYRHEGGTLQLLRRIDWELPAAEFDAHGYREWQCKSQDALAGLLDEQVGPSVDAIVVKCLAKGVMSPLLAKVLAAKYRDAPWLVSSKHGDAWWLKEARPISLLFLPPIPLGELKRVPEWSVGEGEISKDAAEYLETLRSNPTYFPETSAEEQALVAMPRGLLVTALYRNPSSVPDSWSAFTESGVEPAGAGLVGKASIYFAALVANMLLGSSANRRFDEVLRRSLARTTAWIANEVARLSAAGPQLLETDYGTDLLAPAEADRDRRVRGPFVWGDVQSRWRASQERLGIIEQGRAVSTDLKRGAREHQRLCFNLWRGMSAAEGYVAIVERRREAVAQLIRLAESFRRNAGGRAVSCMLLDAPGRGKTLLVRRVAERLGISLLSFNVTQMVHREDLLRCFDVVVTTQARQRDQPLMAFVDEVNALLDGGPVYDLFLAPLEDGVYVRGGNSFRIAPCLWVFADTAAPTQAGGGPVAGATDFLSRLTDGTIALSDPHDNDHSRRLEQVYVGVAMLRDRFPDLRYVTEGVLLAFYETDPAGSLRDLRHFVGRIRDVQYATVSERNLPPDRPRSGDGLPPWVHTVEKDRGRKVEIR